MYIVYVVARYKAHKHIHSVITQPTPPLNLNVHTIHKSTSRCTCNNKEMIFQCKLYTHNTVDPGFGGRGLNIFIPIGEFPSHDSEGNGGSAATCIATCSSYLLVII